MIMYTYSIERYSQYSHWVHVCLNVFLVSPLLIAGALLSCILGASPAYAIGPVTCPWVVADRAFSGGAIEQALCLLAPSVKAARSKPLASLPATFDALVGTAFYTTPQAMEQFMLARGVKEGDVGGPVRLRAALSEEEPAQYFVLHGITGQKDGRPGGLGNVSAGGHVVVAPDGSSKTLEDFFSPLCATRFEKDLRSTRGRFLHVALLSQKRAQVPAVTNVQYRRLADIYIAASARAEKWLIPVFAGTLDKGLNGGAQSPAGFDLDQWADAVREAYRTFFAGR